MNDTKRGPWNTQRFKNRTLIYHDRTRRRFVISQRAEGVSRKTSRRYGENVSRLRIALRAAKDIAARLKNYPASRLGKFKF